MGPEALEPDALAERLARCELGQAPGSAPTWIQTHISHVFLAGDRVYKLRKAVSLSFLDFGTRALRNADCLREVALNRRLAPDVYLGVAPLTPAGEGLEVGAPGPELASDSVEHVVVMRRLPEGGDALARLEAGTLGVTDLERVAATLACFHAGHGLGTPAPWSPEEWLARIERPIRECLDGLEHHEPLARDRLAALRAAVAGRLAELAPRLEARRVAGCAVDGHGDLHLDHVWLEGDGGEPLLIDCVEFDDDLRRIDRASEVAFLAMDLRYRERPDLAEAFLAAYALESDDYGLFPVVEAFVAYRALVRAKVAAIACSQPTIGSAQREAAARSVAGHVALAEACLAAPPPGDVVLLCGTVGTGKSTVARELARRGEGVPIASDRVRKALAGVAAAHRSADGVDEGLYAPEAREAVYRALLDRADDVVASGRTAILDASFTRRADRDRVAEWARARGLRARLVEVRCGVETARERLVRREREGRDPSDAGPGFLETSLARFEPPDEWPSDDHEVIVTDETAASPAPMA